MKPRRLLNIAPLLLILLSSCSVFKLSDSHSKRKLKKGGLEHHILDVEDYTFSYWDTEATDKPVYVLLHGFGYSTHLQWFS